jgi:hypothetical protein
LVAPLVNGELVAEREDLQMHRTSCSEASAEGGEKGDEDSLHGRAEATLPCRHRPPVVVAAPGFA